MAENDNSNGNGNGNGLPGWVRALVQLVFQQGIGAALAVLLVWFLGQRLMNDVQALQSDLRSHTAAAASAVTSAQSFQLIHGEDAKALIGLLRQVCVNTARTDDQRRECVR
jgi:hypothetical protein